MNNPWAELKSPYAILAPMEGVTDLVFRRVIAHAARPDLFVTEFTNVSSYASEAGRPNAIERLAYDPAEAPIIPQIWGKTPEHFAITANGLAEMGYGAIDINMGCPDKHVVANGGGSGLIKTPELAIEIIQATQSTSLPVSVKTRLGYSRVDEWHDWLSLLLQQNLAALTIHLRTKKEMSKVAAHHELIPDIIQLRDQIAPSTKLNLNGDFTDLASAKQYTDLGADGIMIGRGVFANPFCFETTPTEHTVADRINLMLYHLDQFDAYHAEHRTERIPYDPLKRFYKIYINNFPGASDIRVQLMDTHSTAEAREIVYNYLHETV
jgi:tRNA-dihydrouridine synthase